MPYSVLIVDDEMLIREGLRRHLDWATLDMEVIGVADGAESALEIARRRAPDILITDICMRSKTGFDLIEDLLELGLSPQVILISSYNDFSYAQRAVRLECGAGIYPETGGHRRPDRPAAQAAGRTGPAPCPPQGRGGRRRRHPRAHLPQLFAGPAQRRL